MFQKILASIGIGSAKVNLELPSSQAELGGTLEGMVKIEGGSVEQQVDKIYINMVLTSKYGTGDETKHIHKVVAEAQVAGNMTIKPGQKEEIPVSFRIPIDCPISKGRTKYYLQTGLDIAQAIDPKDHDEIVVVPNLYLKMVFDSLRNLGFQEKPRSGDYNGRYQEFEYRPTTFMARELEEIEIYPVAGQRELSLVIQLDKKNTGLFGSLLDEFDFDERFVRVNLPYIQMGSADQVEGMIRELIEREYKKIL